jgi:transcriptional regulator with XRE-family HTH domain
MKSLGQTLKESRELMSLTLRQVEDAVGISNAYLSQLENDKIRNPSAQVLYKLSNLYKVDMETLLIAAGIVIADPKAKIGILKEINAKTKLTHEEEQRLLEYLKFLRSKK